MLFRSHHTGQASQAYIMYEAYIGETIDGYRIVDFIRLHNDVMVYKVEHIPSQRSFLMKYIDFLTAPYETIVTFINEIRVLSSADHPLFMHYVESFCELEKGMVWYDGLKSAPYICMRKL